jgi:hypothetical protein
VLAIAIAWPGDHRESINDGVTRSQAVASLRKKKMRWRLSV